MKKMFAKAEILLIKNPSNLFYFSKYKNEDAVILMTESVSYYLTDARYTEEATEKLSGFIIIDTNRDLWGKIKEIIDQSKAKTLGIENDLPLNFYFEIKNNLNGIETVNISDEISYKRSIKTPHEISLIKKAQQITDKSFSQLLPLIKEGISEFELCRVLENLLYKNGAHGIAFDTIVAFGRNTTRPHAHITNTKLKNNQLIKLDFGATFEGYCSDMTRTVAFGKVSNRESDIYIKVKEAQEIALENIFTGITCLDAYNLANNCFIKNNLDKYFIHSLGHGLGTDVHETPTLSPRSTQVLEENMVVSIEPGLYFTGEFGVRIEDIIVFKKTDVENLTKSEKQMIIL